MGYGNRIPISHTGFTKFNVSSNVLELTHTLRATSNKLKLPYVSKICQDNRKCIEFIHLTLLWRIWKHRNLWCMVRTTIYCMSCLSHILKPTWLHHPFLSQLVLSFLVSLTLEYLGLFWINSRYFFMSETNSSIKNLVYLLMSICILLLNYHCV